MVVYQNWQIWGMRAGDHFNSISYQMCVLLWDRNPMRQVKMWDNIRRRGWRGRKNFWWFCKKIFFDGKNISEIYMYIGHFRRKSKINNILDWNGFRKYFHKHSHYFSSSAWVMFGQKGNVLEDCCANISRVKNVFLTAPPFWRHQIRQPALYWQMYDQGEAILVFKRENVYCHRIAVT